MLPVEVQLAVCAMSVGHTIANDFRKEGGGCFGSGAEGLEWSPYPQYPRLHRWAPWAAPVQAGQQQQHCRVRSDLVFTTPAERQLLPQVTFYALSPMLDADARMMVLLDDVDDLSALKELPLVALEPVCTAQPHILDRAVSVAGALLLAGLSDSERDSHCEAER